MKRKNELLCIEPVTRIEGHARITIRLNKAGDVADSRLSLLSLRGFEKFIEGTPAEEVPRIVTRICGVCPWVHHLASVQAVEGCFGCSPPPAALSIRELCLHLAHVQDKLLHVFFLAAPDFLKHQGQGPSTRSILAVARANPELTGRVVAMRRLSQQMLEILGGKAIHPVAAVAGGFSHAPDKEQWQQIKNGAQELVDFAGHALKFFEHSIAPSIRQCMQQEDIETGFLGMVAPDGALNLFAGHLRLLLPDGSCRDFPANEYQDWLVESILPWSLGKHVHARQEKNAPADLIYRVNTLARLNVADFIPTPLAQAALEAFREQHGRPAQHSMLFHQARLIELLYVCERSMQILSAILEKGIGTNDLRSTCTPGKGRGIGCLEAPRGTLIHDYGTDENGCITRANMIVGTTHNTAAMDQSVHTAARWLIKKGDVNEAILNRIEMAMRAYDP